MSDGVWVKVHPEDAGGAGLEGLGDWAKVTDITGASGNRYTYTADDTDWVAYEWTGDGSVTTTQGLVDLLLVGAGGERSAVTTASLGPGGRSGAGNAGGLVTGLWEVTEVENDIIVGVAPAYGSGQPSTDTTFSGITIPAAGGGYAGPNNRGSSALGSVVGFGNGSPGFKSSITGIETEYGRGGYLGSSANDNWTHDTVIPSEMPSTAGTFGWGGSVFPYDSASGGHGEPATSGVFIIRVPAANALATIPGTWSDL